MLYLIKLFKKYKYTKSRIIKKRLQEKILFEKRLQKFYSSIRTFAKKKKLFLNKYLLLMLKFTKKKKKIFLFKRNYYIKNKVRFLRFITRRVFWSKSKKLSQKKFIKKKQFYLKKKRHLPVVYSYRNIINACYKTRFFKRRYLKSFKSVKIINSAYKYKRNLKYSYKLFFKVKQRYARKLFNVRWRLWLNNTKSHYLFPVPFRFFFQKNSGFYLIKNFFNIKKRHYQISRALRLFRKLFKVRLLFSYLFFKKIVLFNNVGKKNLLLQRKFNKISNPFVFFRFKKSRFRDFKQRKLFLAGVFIGKKKKQRRKLLSIVGFKRKTKFFLFSKKRILRKKFRLSNFFYFILSKFFFTNRRDFSKKYLENYISFDTNKVLLLKNFFFSNSVSFEKNYRIRNFCRFLRVYPRRRYFIRFPKNNNKYFFSKKKHIFLAADTLVRRKKRVFRYFRKYLMKKYRNMKQFLLLFTKKNKFFKKFILIGLFRLIIYVKRAFLKNFKKRFFRAYFNYITKPDYNMFRFYKYFSYKKKLLNYSGLNFSVFLKNLFFYSDISDDFDFINFYKKNNFLRSFFYFSTILSKNKLFFDNRFNGNITYFYYFSRRGLLLKNYIIFILFSKIYLKYTFFFSLLDKYFRFKLDSIYRLGTKHKVFSNKIISIYKKYNLSSVVYSSFNKLRKRYFYFFRVNHNRKPFYFFWMKYCQNLINNKYRFPYRTNILYSFLRNYFVAKILKNSLISSRLAYFSKGCFYRRLTARKLRKTYYIFYTKYQDFFDFFSKNWHISKLKVKARIRFFTRPTMHARLLYFKKLRQKLTLFKRFSKRRFNLNVLKVSKELPQSVQVGINVLSNSFIKTRRKFKGVRRQRRVYPNTRFTKFYFKKLIYFKALIKRNFLFTMSRLNKSKRKNFNFSIRYKFYQKNGFLKSLNFFEFFLPNVVMHSFRLFNFNIAKKLISQGAVVINHKQITYKNYIVKLGDIIHLQPKFMYNHLHYFNFIPYGFLLYLQTKWKWSYYQIINFKTLHTIYYAPLIFIYPKKKRWLKKKWLAFFFYFVK